MTQRDQKRLEGVHPDLRGAYALIDGAMNLLGFPVFVVDGLRTTAEQQREYAKGRTTEGRIVTKADGVVKKSNHQAADDGFGHAIDFAFVDDPRTPKDETWDPHMPWDLVGLMGEKLGLVWGGRWTRPVDLGHLELPKE